VQVIVDATERVSKFAGGGLYKDIGGNRYDDNQLPYWFPPKLMGPGIFPPDFNPRKVGDVGSADSFSR